MRGGTFAARARRAVVEPLREFLTRQGAWTILAFVALFKLGEAMAGIMTAPFYRSLGFDRAAVAATGPFSLVATLGGIMVGGWIVARIGVGRALLWTGWAQTVAMVMYEVLAHSPGVREVLFLTVATEAFAQGMADAAFLTYLSGLCSRNFTATHYALLSSVPALAIHTIGGVLRLGREGGGVGGVLRHLHLRGAAGDGSDAGAAAAVSAGGGGAVRGRLLGVCRLVGGVRGLWVGFMGEGKVRLFKNVDSRHIP